MSLLEINEIEIGEIAGPMKGYKAMDRKVSVEDDQLWEPKSVKVPRKTISRGTPKNDSENLSLLGSGHPDPFPFKSKKLSSLGRDDFSNCPSVKSNLIQRSELLDAKQGNEMRKKLGLMDCKNIKFPKDLGSMRLATVKPNYLHVANLPMENTYFF